MIIKNIEVSYRRTVQIDQFEPASTETTIGAELTPEDNVKQCIKDLHKQAYIATTERIVAFNGNKKAFKAQEDPLTSAFLNKK
jgi:hypothetical protein